MIKIIALALILVPQAIYSFCSQCGPPPPPIWQHSGSRTLCLDSEFGSSYSSVEEATANGCNTYTTTYITAPRTMSKCTEMTKFSPVAYYLGDKIKVKWGYSGIPSTQITLRFMGSFGGTFTEQYSVQTNLSAKYHEFDTAQIGFSGGIGQIQIDVPRSTTDLTGGQTQGETANYREQCEFLPKKTIADATITWKSNAFSVRNQSKIHVAINSIYSIKFLGLDGPTSCKLVFNTPSIGNQKEFPMSVTKSGPIYQMSLNKTILFDNLINHITQKITCSFSDGTTEDSTPQAVSTPITSKTHGLPSIIFSKAQLNTGN